MDSHLPRVSVGLYHLRLASEIRICPVFDVALANEGLEVRAEFHAVRRIKVDHLHLTTETFKLEHRVHDLERVAKDHAVLPGPFMFVRIQLVADVKLCIAK